MTRELNNDWYRMVRNGSSQSVQNQIESIVVRYFYVVLLGHATELGGSLGSDKRILEIR